MIYRTVAMVVLSLLLSVSSAVAECAWVLWAHMMISDPDIKAEQWTLLRAYQTENACERDRLGETDKLQKSTESVVAASKVPSAKVTARGLCLPDTIDPRGPKGK